MWDAILEAGAEFGIEVYGTEALHILRAEKGYIVVGDETDGTTTPDDVGLSGLVSKKKADFLGKRSLEQSYLKQPGRKQLVGLLTDDPNFVLPDGAHAVKEVKPKPPMQTIGHVTSTYFSPTLNRSIAMALIENGRARIGRELAVSARRQNGVGQDRRSGLLRQRGRPPEWLSPNIAPRCMASANPPALRFASGRCRRAA